MNRNLFGSLERENRIKNKSTTPKPIHLKFKMHTNRHESLKEQSKIDCDGKDYILL
jgi:hypothetical protein